MSGEPRISQRAESPARHRRAGRACLGCRARKVRCNFFESHPCSNCRWNRIPCIVPRSRRRARKYLYDEQEETPAAEYCEADFVDTGVSWERHCSPRKASPKEPSPALSASLLETSQAVDERSQQLPPLFKPLPIIEPSYAAFLQSQGALSLPSVSLQRILIKSYIDFAYPRMPIIDLANFCNVLGCTNGSRGQVSLVLYHAVLFAGSAFLRSDVLVNAGYTNTRSLRKDLYKRTELLFELGAEQDRLILLQVALLLSSRSVSQSESKDSWYWLNTAISLAYALGLHRNPGQSLIFDPYHVRLSRRIWWSCYLRDKILALGVSRPTRIKDEDFETSMLRPDDFELQGLSSRLPLLDHDHIGPYDKSQLLESAELLIEKTKLFTLINRVLQRQQETAFETFAMAEDTPGRAHSVDAIESALKTWLADLPPSCRWSAPLEELPSDNMTTSIHVRRNLLHMSFHTAMYSLHRPRFLPSSPHQAPSEHIPLEARARSRAVVLDSVNKITLLAAELHQHKLDGNLPLAAITVLYPAICMHLLNMKSRSDDVRQAAIHRFRVCMRIMEKLRELYASADATIGYLEVVLRSAFVAGAPWASSSAEGVFQLNRQDRSDISAVLGYGLSPDAELDVVIPDMPGIQQILGDEESPADVDMDIGAIFREVCPGSPLGSIEALLDLDFGANGDTLELDLEWPDLEGVEGQLTPSPSDAAAAAVL